MIDNKSASKMKAELSFTDPDACTGGMGAGAGTSTTGKGVAGAGTGAGMAGGGSGSARPSFACVSQK